MSKKWGISCAQRCHSLGPHRSLTTFKPSRRLQATRTKISQARRWGTQQCTNTLVTRTSFRKLAPPPPHTGQQGHDCYCGTPRARSRTTQGKSASASHHPLPHRLGPIHTYSGNDAHEVASPTRPAQVLAARRGSVGTSTPSGSASIPFSSFSIYSSLPAPLVPRSLPQPPLRSNRRHPSEGSQTKLIIRPSRSLVARSHLPLELIQLRLYCLVRKLWRRTRLPWKLAQACATTESKEGWKGMEGGGREANHCPLVRLRRYTG